MLYNTKKENSLFCLVLLELIFSLGLKEEEVKEGTYLDINRFNVFLEDTVDLDSLFYETAMVLKTVTSSSGSVLKI